MLSNFYPADLGGTPARSILLQLPLAQEASQHGTGGSTADAAILLPVHRSLRTYVFSIQMTEQQCSLHHQHWAFETIYGQQCLHGLSKLTYKQYKISQTTTAAAITHQHALSHCTQYTAAEPCDLHRL